MIPMMLRPSRRTLLAALAAMILAAPANSARAAYSSNLYSAGHADISIGYESGALTLNWELATNAVINGTPLPSGRDVAPGDLTAVVGTNVLATGNAGLPAPFANAPMYVLGQTSVGAASRPFIGFGAESVDPGLFVGDTLRLELVSLAPPAGGNVVVWTNGAAGSPAINSANGLTSADGIDVFALGHDHYNLGFTTAGIYDLTLRASGTLVGGGTLSTTETFRFAVNAAPSAVPEPASLAMVGLGLASACAFQVRRRVAGRRAA
jgi:surface-anchored protein